MTKNKPTVQSKIEDLRKLVEWFDGDDFSLEESLEKFSEARNLATEIEEELTSLKNEVEIAKQSFDQKA